LVNISSFRKTGAFLERRDAGLFAVSVWSFAMEAASVVETVTSGFVLEFPRTRLGLLRISKWGGVDWGHRRIGGPGPQ